MIEATGSFWASFIFHMCVNSSSVILSYGQIVGGAQPQSLEEAIEMTGGMGYRETLLMIIAIYMVIAAVTTTIGGCLLYLVAKNEGQVEKIKALFDLRKEKNNHKMITLPFVITVVLCIAFMLLEIWLLKK